MTDNKKSCNDDRNWLFKYFSKDKKRKDPRIIEDDFYEFAYSDTDEFSEYHVDYELKNLIDWEDMND